ncbi:MAG: chaperonin GroEL [Anaerolineae bacterium]|nr:chaperonin GroEL [Anaerolineae bacterium]
MAKRQNNQQTPQVVFQPRVYKGMQKGIGILVNAIRPTLGPIHRVVAIEKEAKIGKPELLDNGATIARRIIQLQNREEDMGAMYVRNILWRMHETVGDGTATAAVMFQTIYDEGMRYIVAGGDAMRLRRHLEEASETILGELAGMVTPLQGKEHIAKVAETICYDPPLAKMLGEIFDIIGEYGRLEIRAGRSRELEREYIEGMYWNGGIFSRKMFQEPTQEKVQMQNAPVLISDLEIKEPHELLPALDTAARAGFKTLLLIASSISEQALAILLTKPNRERIHVVATKPPAYDTVTRNEALEDLAILTGGKVFFKAAGDTLNAVRIEDFGQTRRAWVDTANFGIIGGKGDPRQLRHHIARLRAGLTRVEEPKDRTRLQERIGKLIGGSAALFVGAHTPPAVEERKELAKRTADALRGAIRDGVLPGGGTALLACQQAIQKKMNAATNTDERAACNIMLQALEAPTRTLLNNAGFNVEKELNQISLAGSGYGFDVIRGQVADMAHAGIYDAASVIGAAVSSAVHGAALALTIDVLVHRKSPPEAHHTT